MESKAQSEPGFGAALAEAHTAYAAERDALIGEETGPNPSGGVGGAAKGVKCLHAHYAHFAAGRDNPVGELVASWVEPLDCEIPCVDDEGPNPRWTAKP